MSQQDFDRGMAWDAMERATRATELANQAIRDGVAHEAICAERYNKISEDIAGLRGLFKWAGGALFTLLLAVFGFLINQVSTTNTSLQDKNNAATIAASRIDLLQQTLANERRARGGRQEPPVER